MRDCASEEEAIIAIETTPWDIQGYLLTEERRLDYHEAALEPGDLALVAVARDDIAIARELAGRGQKQPPAPRSEQDGCVS